MLAAPLVLSLSLGVPALSPPQEDDSTARAVAEGLAVAAVGGASLATFAVEKNAFCQPGVGGCGFELFMLHLASSSLVASLASWGIHRLAGGRGRFQVALEAYLASALLWPIVWYVLTGASTLFTDAVGVSQLSAVAGLLTYGIPGVLLAAPLTAFVLEDDARSQPQLQGWVAPHGAGLALVAHF